MNPENQNPGGYQNPPQPQQGAPGQPAPQIYGPQQYYPMPVDSTGLPGQPPKKSKKKLMIVVLVITSLLAVVILAAVFISINRANGPGSKGISRAYDTPVGLVPGMQSASVQSGKFKLTASYVTGGDFTREGTFTVKDGHVYFDMVPDYRRVNELMRFLYMRRGGKIPFDESIHGTSKIFSYDLAAMLGYHYLYDTNAGEFSGFIPAVEAAKSAAAPSPRYTLTTACDTALTDVKRRTDMDTLGLVFEVQEEGINKQQAKVSFSTLQAVDKSVTAFFDSCFDLTRPDAAKLKNFVDARRDNITKSPTFTYWQEDGVDYLDISAPPKDTPFGGTMHFELKDLSNSPAESVPTEASSYIERRNQFGLAYSLCRVDPVVTTSLSAGYRFIREDPAYRYPNISDTGYFCTSLMVPSQFTPAASLALRTTTGTPATVSGAGVDGLRGLHDLTYEVEQYNINNKRYPGSTEFRDMANSNMASLTSVTQTAFANKSLVYTPMPEGCVGTCNDFVLSFVPVANVQVRRTTYRP